MHAHGALGVSNEMPFGGMWMMAPVMSVVDGPTEVHKVTVAREVLKDYQPVARSVAHGPPPGQARGGPPEAGRAHRARRRELLSSADARRPLPRVRPTLVRRRRSRCRDPVPSEGQVVVDVAAAAVNFPDVLLVADQYQIHVPVPFTVGSEFAGTVRARRGRRGRAWPSVTG